MKPFPILAAFGSLVAIALFGCQKQSEPDFMTQDDITPLQADDPEVADYSDFADGHGPDVRSDITMVSVPVQDGTSEHMNMGNRTHTIQRGDTLWSIARRTYGDGQRWREISAANPGLEPRSLHIGQQIILP